MMSTSISSFRPTAKSPQFSGRPKVKPEQAVETATPSLAELAKQVEELKKRKTSNKKTNWWSGINTVLALIGVTGSRWAEHSSSRGAKGISRDHD
jgi:hypothetical protein